MCLAVLAPPARGVSHRRGLPARGRTQAVVAAYGSGFNDPRP